MANNLSKGEVLVGGKTLNENVPLFTDIFEVKGATHLSCAFHTSYVPYPLFLLTR